MFAVLPGAASVLSAAIGFGVPFVTFAGLVVAFDALDAVVVAGELAGVTGVVTTIFTGLLATFVLFAGALPQPNASAISDKSAVVNKSVFILVVSCPR